MPPKPQRGEPANRPTYTKLSFKDYDIVDKFSKETGRTVSQTLRWALIEAGVLPKFPN
jgi:hypothetical protein